MGNFFVPIELCCVFLRESLPSLPTNKTLLLFPRKAVGALGHHLATAGTLAPQPPTHRRSGPRVPEFRTSLIQTGAKLSTRGLGADFLIQLRATRRDVKSPRPKNVLSLSAGSLSGASIIKFLNNSAPAPLCLPGQRMCCREAQEAFPGDP